MGQRLATAVDAYNAAVGSLERQVMPQARRFGELGVTGDAPLAPLEPVGQLVRSTGAPSAAESPPSTAADESKTPSGTAPEASGDDSATTGTSNARQA
jgi:hypothetical protein